MTLDLSPQSDTPASPLERLIGKASRLHIPPLLVGLIAALILTLMAGTLGIQLSREYYATAPYHYDSATYRVQAATFFQTIQTEGRISAFLKSLQMKDSFDLTLRILFAPRYLVDPFGHLVIELPFMCLFLFLATWYVFSRTRSMWIAIAIASVIFIFPLIYSPIRGIADYWKDSFAAWLWGSAIVTWLLAENLKRYTWSFLCGLLLAALVVQRSSVAVYAAALFAPLFICAVFRRTRSDRYLQTIKRVAAFVAPILVIGGVVILLQWQLLYTYYMAFGYAYGDPASVAGFLLNEMKATDVAPFLAVLAGLCLFGTLSIRTWKSQINEIAVAAWFVVGLPVVISISSAFYHSFTVIWAVQLVILLATLAPRTWNAAKQRLFAAAVMLVAVGASAVQYQVSSQKAQQDAAYSAPRRALFEQLAAIILAQPEPRNYVLLFDEVAQPFWNQVFFDHGVRLNQPMLFTSAHDSYYRALYGNRSAQQIVENYATQLEQQPGGVAVGYCTPGDSSKNPYYEGNPVAIQVSSMLSDYVLNSPHWMAVSKVAGPYGCLFAYQHSSKALTPQEKWGNLAFHNAMDEIPLSLPLGPSVKIYDYTSRYPPEHYNGGYYQWLPSGPGGLRLTLFSDQPRRVSLQAQAIIGPARKDPQRTLVMSNGSQNVATVVEDQQAFQIDFDLQAGLNHIEFYVEEPPDSMPSAGTDSRELMLLLVSPRLVPVTS